MKVVKDLMTAAWSIVTAGFIVRHDIWTCDTKVFARHNYLKYIHLDGSG